MGDPKSFLDIRIAKCTKIDLDEAKLHTNWLMKEGVEMLLNSKKGC